MYANVLSVNASWTTESAGIRNLTRNLPAPPADAALAMCHVLLVYGFCACEAAEGPHVEHSLLADPVHLQAAL